MKKTIFFLACAFFSIVAFAQPKEETKAAQETARQFMVSGDFNNAVMVLNRAIDKDPGSLALQKDLAYAYFLKRDYTKALEASKKLLDRDDVDEASFQIAGNVYKALEEVKDADKMYKRALKKFPNSGPLYSEYGELLYSAKDFSAIDQWEKGIQMDPSYSGNYYNAARHYFFTKDKVWSLIYGEIFVNMESLSERGAAMKQLLLDSYKEKLFAEPDLMKGQEKNKNEFSKAFLETMNKQSSLANKGLTMETITMARTRFILDWYNTYSAKFPYKLFDYQRQLIQEGMFEAYDQWLFGTVNDLAAYDTWTKAHPEAAAKFANFQKNRVFKMPGNQYYH